MVDMDMFGGWDCTTVRNAPTYTRIHACILTHMHVLTHTHTQPVVITPEGNPRWLSDEDVLAKGLPESEVENFK